MYKLVIFDMDGTLLDTREGMANAYMHGCKEMGLKEDNPKAIYEYVGINTSIIFKERHGLEGEDYTKAVDIYHRYYEEKGMKELEAYRGIAQLLQDLKDAGAKLAIATARGIGQTTEMLDIGGLTKYFDFFRTSQPGQHLGDKDEAVKDCIDKMKVQPNEAVMIGDRKFDLNGAVHNGVDCIGVTYGFGERDELQACKPTHVVDSVDEMRPILLGK